VNPVASLR